MRLLQISDPHFGRERPEVVAGLLTLAHALAPQLIVLSGDLTQRATRVEFAAARRFTDRLPPAPLLVLPGNHDIPLYALWLRLLRPYGRYAAAFGEQLEAEWQSPALLVQTVKTTRRWRHKDGQLSRAQIERVAARLEQAGPEQLRVVVLHHPIAVTRDEDRENLLHGHDAAAARWAAAGADIVMGGHIHLPFVLGLHEQRPALSQRLWAVQAGTAVSSRTRHEAGNSVNVLEVLPPQASQRCCEVQRWDWREEAGLFEQAARQPLLCGPRS